MLLVRGGTFLMGSNDFYEEEKPVREARVGDFWMDETPVTNREFSRFVAATGYVTFAELPPDPREYPGMLPEMTHPGSLVFIPPEHPVDVHGPPVWWKFVFGACWKRPLGHCSGIEGLEDHPVVHIVHADAAAYAHWAGKRLPNEAEWEYAARGGSNGLPYAWGTELEPDGVGMAKIFRGTFPHENLAPPGLERTSPVRSYPPNAYGLYDMIGNVWEWTDEWYRTRPVGDGPECCSGDRPRPSPARAEDSLDPTSPAPHIPRRVTKGGSHLCAPNYCRRYRPAARWPQPIDTSTSHIGFRCIAPC